MDAEDTLALAPPGVEPDDGNEGNESDGEPPPSPSPSPPEAEAAEATLPPPPVQRQNAHRAPATGTADTGTAATGASYGPQSSSSSSAVFCNNCGRTGHLFHQCKSPIISIGIITFRYNVAKNQREYLMIRRKNTLGFVDFIRGKYPIYDHHYLHNIVCEMTCAEKQNILTKTFDELWCELWGDQRSTYYNEERSSRNKFNQLRAGIQMNERNVTIEQVVREADRQCKWDEPEWGFPKGRRNYMEKDYTCAVREFQEETGYSKNNIRVIHNIIPYEETFIGSNLRCYKHKYYIAYIQFEHTFQMNNFQKNEVSEMRWCSFTEAVSLIRYYNQEKITLIKNIETTLNNYIIVI